MGKMNHTKAVRERHKAAARIEELEAQLAAAEATARAVVKAEVDRLRANNTLLAAQLEVEREEAVALGNVLAKERRGRHDDYERHQTAIGVKEAQLEALRSDRDRWRTEAEAAAPGLEAAGAVITDLTKLLTDVRASMTKRQRERESAILNRKAVAIALRLAPPEVKP